MREEIQSFFNKTKKKNLTLRERLLNFADNKDLHEFLLQSTHKLQTDIQQKGIFWHSQMQLIIYAEIDGWLNKNRKEIEKLIKSIEEKIKVCNKIYSKTTERVNKRKDDVLFGDFQQFQRVYYRRIQIFQFSHQALREIINLFENAKKVLKTEGNEQVRLDAESRTFYMLQQIMGIVRNMITYSKELNNLHDNMIKMIYEAKKKTIQQRQQQKIE